MKRCLILILCICLLTGCAGGFSNGRNADPAKMPQEQVFDLLFDIKNKVYLQLDMPEEELAKMQADYEAYDCNGSKSPIYRMADLQVTVTTPDGSTYNWMIEEVGVRMKGNTSRTDFYSPERGLYNIIHLKLSFQEAFDDEEYYGADAKVWDEAERENRKDRTFATLEKLDLRWNRCDDSTYLKEYFAYETYRRNGVLAPHTNLAAFEWAGIHMGVFTINEPIDKLFLKKYLPDDACGGDLYKVGWAGSNNGSFLTTDSIGIENEDKGEFFAYDLKTNKKSSAHESLTSFINAMNAEVTKESFAELVDLEAFLPFAAVSYLLGNPDDMRNNYNNFYVYFRSDNGKAVFIPYDYDRCLGITAHWNPTGNGVTRDNPFSAKLLGVTPDSGEQATRQRNPVILYSVAQGGYYVREYADLLAKIAESDWFRYESFESLYKIAHANYGQLTKPEKQFDNTRDLMLSFDIHRTSDYRSNGNICIREYLASKLTTMYSYLAELEYYAEEKPLVNPVWYIRADFTDWQMDDRYLMDVDAGTVTIRIDLKRTSALKVYNIATDRWYGSECVSPDCKIPVDTDSYTNIILPEGMYTLIFDIKTETIFIQKD